VLRSNGSPRATVVTDEERTFFRITIPCHAAAGNIIADTHKDGSLKASRRSRPISGPIIVNQIRINPHASYNEISKQTGLSRSWVAEVIKRLQVNGIIKRIGTNKTGYWEIIDE